MSEPYVDTRMRCRHAIHGAARGCAAVTLALLVAGCGSGAGSPQNANIGFEWSGTQQSSSLQQGAGPIHLSLGQSGRAISGTAQFTTNNTMYQGLISGSYTLSTTDAQLTFTSDYYASYGAVQYTGTVSPDGQTMTLQYTRPLTNGGTDSGSATLTRDQQADERSARKR